MIRIGSFILLLCIAVAALILPLELLSWMRKEQGIAWAIWGTAIVLAACLWFLIKSSAATFRNAFGQRMTPKLSIGILYDAAICVVLGCVLMASSANSGTWLALPALWPWVVPYLEIWDVAQATQPWVLRAVELIVAMIVGLNVVCLAGAMLLLGLQKSSTGSAAFWADEDAAVSPLDELAKDNAALTSEVVTLRKHIAELEPQANDAQEARTLVAELEKTIALHEQEAFRLGSECRVANRGLAEMEQRHGSLRAEYEAAMGIVQRQTSQIEDLHRTIRALEATERRLKHQRDARNGYQDAYAEDEHAEEEHPILTLMRMDGDVMDIRASQGDTITHVPARDAPSEPA